MNEEYVDLYTLQKDMKDGLEGLFPDKLWVKAEIASIGVKSGGHCYMDLVQSRGGNLVAKVHGIIWRSYYNLLNAKYKSETGKPISAGTEVLLRVEVNFHEVYGLSLIADDIVPISEVSGQSLKRAQTIERLTREGLLDKQKSLQMTDLPYNLAIISAEGAAGLGDFRRHLLQNEFGFAYNLVLFPATMQGDSAPESIVAALKDIELAHRKGLAANAQGEGRGLSADAQGEVTNPVFDAVLLLRGGGAETDLLCFDDYSISAAIARLPIPVITAIGHDKDFHIADMVAYSYVKTPTALADMFIDLTAQEDERISLYANRLALAFQNRVGALEGRLNLLEQKIGAGGRAILAAADAQLGVLEQKIGSSFRAMITTAEANLGVMEQKIGVGFRAMLAAAEARIGVIDQKIGAGFRAQIAKEEAHIGLLEAKIAATDPRSVLSRGFSLALNAKGQKMNSAAEAKSGEKMSVLFADGRVDAVVEDVAKRPVF